MKRLALILMLTVPVASYGLDEWRPLDTRLQVAFTAVGVLDIALTDYAFSQVGGIKEQNPVLGKNPSRAKLWGLGLSGLATHAIVSRLLPHDMRTLWQSMGLSAEVTVSLGNSMIIIGGKL